tara:strand:+ start:765 stop:1055 length:291 start_codon:yes stop_codon:yes gene_type:complete
MKKITIIGGLTILSLSLFAFVRHDEKPFAESVISVQSDYEDGWEDGYCEGWKDVKGQLALCPLTPLCPLPKIECSEGYKCGYNRGFKAGMKAASKN